MKLDIEIRIDLQDIGKSIELSDRLVSNQLALVCKRTQNNCNNECPVFAVSDDVPFDNQRSCMCKDSGSDMLDYLMIAEGLKAPEPLLSTREVLELFYKQQPEDRENILYKAVMLMEQGVTDRSIAICKATGFTQMENGWKKEIKH
jgi:hypothetical protein